MRDKLKFFANEPVRGLRIPVFLRTGHALSDPARSVHASRSTRFSLSPPRTRTHLKSPIYWARELLIFLPYKGVGEENTWKHKEKEEGLVSLSSNVERIEDECNLSGSGFGEGEGD